MAPGMESVVRGDQDGGADMRRGTMVWACGTCESESGGGMGLIVASELNGDLGLIVEPAWTKRRAEEGGKGGTG